VSDRKKKKRFWIGKCS